MIQGGQEEEEGEGWQLGPEMPSVMARSCAVTVDDNTIVMIGEKDSLEKKKGGIVLILFLFSIIGGHDNASTNSLPLGYQLDISEGTWTTLPQMIVPRRDHACLLVEFEKARGILVTGGNIRRTFWSNINKDLLALQTDLSFPSSVFLTRSGRR